MYKRQLLLGDGRAPLAVVGLALVLAGGFALFVAARGEFLPHDVAFLGMTPGELCAVNECRIVHFMIHDRVAFGGALIAVGTMYLWLTVGPMARGERWAWELLAASGAVGFASFLAYLGYGYLDTWHGTATAALQTLELPDNLLTETGAAGLLATEHFPALREIDLANNPIPPERWPELVLSARDRPHLDVYFFPAGWRGSEREPVTRTISGEDVRLCITRDSGAALDELARCPALARVTGLVLRNRTIPADTAAALAAALAGGRLRDLDLSGCVLDDNPLPHILGFCANPHLAVLSLARMGLKYPIIARLALSPAVSHLRVLDLSDNPIGAGGLDAVLGSPHLRGLERFVFRGTMGLSQRERAHFQKQFGKRAEF